MEMRLFIERFLNKHIIGETTQPHIKATSDANIRMYDRSKTK